jgi:glycosidase
MAAIKHDHAKVRVVGEMFDGDASLVSYFQGGKVRDGVDTGVDTVFDFPMYYAIRDVFAKGNPVKALSSALSHDYLYPHPELLVTFLGLHDVTRFMNESGATRDGLKLAFTYLFTTRGIPMMYYGDELAMPGGNDPDNRRDFPGGWLEDPRNAFTQEGRTEEQREVFDYVRKLARLRRQLPDLRKGTLTELVMTDTVYAYSRGEVIVVLNNGKTSEPVNLPLKPGAWQDALGTLGEVQPHLMLPAHSAAILIRK